MKKRVLILCTGNSARSQMPKACSGMWQESASKCKAPAHDRGACGPKRWL